MKDHDYNYWNGGNIMKKYIENLVFPAIIMFAVLAFLLGVTVLVDYIKWR